jgi:hypothetical protein
MKITEQDLRSVHRELRTTCGGLWQDYFGLLWLEQVHKVPREQARDQVAFGNNDYGVDGFHYDEVKRNLYLFQFKWSKEHEQIKGSYERLIADGVAQIFGNGPVDRKRNGLLDALRAVMQENRKAVAQVYFEMVFCGDPDRAENSTVLQALQEDLGNRKHLIDHYFDGRDITLVIQYRSITGKRSHTVESRTHEYPLGITGLFEAEGPDGQQMMLGMGRLYDLYSMFRQMGPRFFERNIRYSLPEDGSVNRVLMRAYRNIAIDRKVDASAFAFDHNGVTFSAQKVEQIDGQLMVTEPRLLNGAQTITTLAGFIEKNKDRPDIESIKDRLRKMQVICKVITGADESFITSVTINNNRQNPVAPWNLRANDPVQLAFSDMFKDRLGVYYERQQRAFDYLTEEEREEQGITESKAVEMLRLAKTLLASDGDLYQMKSMQKVFEEDRLYDQVFNMRRLEVDDRQLLLCYKIQFRLPLLSRALQERAEKYDFVRRGRDLLWALMCQAVLNDKEVEHMAEQYGKDLSLSTNYVEYLRRLALNEVRPLLGDLAALPANREKIKEGKFDFIRSKQAYDHCMEVARKRFRWQRVQLKG